MNRLPRMEGMGAVIPAAGRSARMGQPKIFLPLGGKPVLLRTVRIFRDAGVAEIVVVLREGGGEAVSFLEDAGLRWAWNQTGDMLSSVQAGVRRLSASCRAFFVLPADMPLVRPETLAGLHALFLRETPDACRPLYRGRRGHPPLLSTGLVPSLLAFAGEGGLRAFLADPRWRIRELPCDDPGILRDMDTRADFARMQREVEKLHG